MQTFSNLTAYRHFPCLLLCLVVTLAAWVTPAVTAGPVVLDGIINVGEYDVLLADPNEASVADNLDISRGAIAGGNQLSIGWDVFSKPYDVDGEDDNDENFVRLAIDLNNDGVTDYRVRIDGSAAIGNVYRGSTGLANSAGTFSSLILQDTPEAQVPWSLFTPSNGAPSVFIPGADYAFRVRWHINGGGDSADDTAPGGTGWHNVVLTATDAAVPEPTTAGLAGLGVLALMARRCTTGWVRSNRNRA